MSCCTGVNKMELLISENDIVYLQLNCDALEDYYDSKLCYMNYEAAVKGEKVVINYGNGLCYDKETDVYFIPQPLSEEQQCFLLRCVIDAVQLKRGNLPMHTAAVSDGNKTFVIAAESGRGKSYISNKICKSFHEYDIIGDDHIIISSDYIQGNKKRRIRNINTEEYEYTKNKGLCSMNELIFICYDYSENENYTVNLSGSDVSEAFAAKTAFKYLNETFVHNDISYRANVLADMNINDTYRERLLHFLNGKKAVFIHGTQEYAVDLISCKIKTRRYL